MRVNPQVRNLSGAEIEARASNASDCAVGGNAVNCAVRLIAAPGPTLNYLVGRLFSHNEGECANHTAALFTYVAYAIRNIGTRRVGIGVFSSPLRGVSMLTHEDTGPVIDGSHRVDIGKRGLANLHEILRVSNAGAPFRGTPARKSSTRPLPARTRGCRRRGPRRPQRYGRRCGSRCAR